MNAIKKILVPLDFSPTSAEALRFAVDLSLKYEASITILYVDELVFIMSPYAPLPANTIQNWISEGRTLLENAKGDALKAGATDVDAVLLQGRASPEIIRVAHDGNFDLIVMGTHGRSGVDRVLIGSVAERVVRRAPCPVLTVGLPHARSADEKT